MKKVLFSSLMCAAALMIGCSKDTEIGQNPEDSSTNIKVRGTIVTDGTKVTIGDYESGAETVPIYWTDTDFINLALITTETGAIVQTGGGIMVNRYGGMWQAMTTTPSQSTYFEKKSGFMQDSQDGQSYIAFHTNALNQNVATQQNFKSVTTVYKKDQTYNVKTKRTDGNLLVATAPGLEEGQESIDLQFRNTLATLMLGVKGSAKLTGLTVAAADKTLGYEGNVTLDMTNAPEAGVTDLSSYISGGTESSEVNMSFSQPLTLTEDITWIPVTVLPIEGLAGTKFTVTFKGNDQEGKEATTERTITVPAAAGDLTTNSIAYLNFKDVKYSDLDQKEPKEDWKAGDEVLDDDFAWIMDAKPERAVEFGLTDAAMTLPEKGSVSTYFSIEPASHGYLVQSSYVQGLYSYEGFAWTGSSPYQGAAALIYPLSDLGSTPVDLTISFKAMGVYTTKGEPASDDTSTAKPYVYASVVSGSEVVGELKQSTADLDPFTWYDFTFIVKDVTRDMELTLGSTTASYLFCFDDLNIKITEETDKANLTGTKSTDTLHAASGAVAATTTGYMYPEDGNITVSNIGNDPIISTTYTLPAGIQYLYFQVSGEWTLEVDEASKDWLQVTGPTYDYSYKGSPWFADENGNQLITPFVLNPIQNGGSAERTATITVKSGNNTVATFTVKQPALGEKKELFACDFGTSVEAGKEENINDEMDGSEFGITKGNFDSFLVPFNSEGTNPGLALSGKALEDEDNTSSTALSNYLFFAKTYTNKDVSALENNEKLWNKTVTPPPFPPIGDGPIFPPLVMAVDDDDAGDDAEVEAVDPVAVLSLDVYGKDLVFIEFELYRVGFYGNFNMEIMFDEDTENILYGSTSYYIPGNNNAYGDQDFSISQTYTGWQFNKLRFDVPKDANDCRIAFYSYIGSSSTAYDGQYYIDNLNIYAY